MGLPVRCCAHMSGVSSSQSLELSKVKQKSSRQLRFQQELIVDEERM